MTYLKSYDVGLEYIENLDGIGWLEAAVPARRHHCQPQTRGFIRPSGYVERCACGAVGRGDGIWIERNIRRRSAPPALMPWWRRLLKGTR